MIQEVIVQRLAIERIGEKHHFQIALPRDTKRIIGLEYGTLEKDGVLLPGGPPVPGISEYFRVARSKIIGRLSMKYPGPEGTFYQGDLTEDRNSSLHERIAGVLWQPKSWTHGRKREEINFSINSRIRFIEGLFEDSYGASEYADLYYQLNIYLWIEKCVV